MDFIELKKYVEEKLAPDRNKWVRKNQYFYNDILRFFRFSVPENSRVLELGFDDGWLLYALKPSRGVYLGISEILNEQGHIRHPELVFVADKSFGDMPLDEEFDYIILSNIIGSVTDLQVFFNRLVKVSTERTRIIVTYYNYLWQPFIRLAEKVGLKQKQPVLNWLSKEDIVLLLDLAGFEVVKQGQRLLIPKYIPVISWLFNRVFARFPILNKLNFWNYVIVRPRPNYEKAGDYSVSVIVPARNEKGNIEAIVRRIPEMGKGTEIIFVEGGSSDGTLEEIKRVAEKYGNAGKIRWTAQEGKGKGDAVRKGFSLATGDVLMILDADMTVPPEDLPKFYKVIATRRGEYVQGTRLIYPMEEQAMRFLNLIANKFFSMFFSWLLKQRVKDTLCGTKVLFRSDYLILAANRKYFGDFDPFGDFDLIFGANKLNLKMVEIPVRYRQRAYGSTNISRFRHGLLLLRMCFFAIRKLE